MMNRDLRCDVVFHVKDEVSGVNEFRAHKIFLANCSSVFEVMFYGSGTELAVEKNAQGMDVVRIDDISSATFGLSMNIIYGSITANYLIESIDMVEEICYMAEKYDIECLRLHCDKFLCRKLNNSNCVQMVSWAIKYHLSELEVKARTRVFSENGLKIIAEGSEQIDPDTAVFLLRGGDLSSEHSKSVVLAAISYARKLVSSNPVDGGQDLLEKALQPLSEYLLTYSFLFDDQKELFYFYKSRISDASSSEVMEA